MLSKMVPTEGLMLIVIDLSSPSAGQEIRSENRYCTAIVLSSCTATALLLYCYATTVLLHYYCTAALLLYCCTAMVLVHCYCTAALLLY